MTPAETLTRAAEILRDEDAHWIALMSPDVTASLIAWLRGEAVRQDYNWGPPPFGYALDFARALVESVDGEVGQP